MLPEQCGLPVAFLDFLEQLFINAMALTLTIEYTSMYHVSALDDDDV